MNFNIAWPDLALGATLMYMLDPTLGGIRRERLLARTVWTCRFFARQLGARVRRLPGMRTGQPAPSTEAELVEQVREGLEGISHPNAIEVKVESGQLTLSGPILAREVVEVLRRVRRVQGVLRVHNRLRVRRASEAVPEWEARPRKRPARVALEGRNPDRRLH